MRVAAALAAAVALIFASGAPAAAKPAPARDWSRTVAATPEGGFRMGNPAAKVKLIEYGSLACPHCRHFEETGYKPLVAKYVRTGRVSYEFRNLLLNSPDIAVSLLAHCAGPARFFPMSVEVFASQPQWEAKVINLQRRPKGRNREAGRYAAAGSLRRHCRLPANCRPLWAQCGAVASVPDRREGPSAAA